MRRLLWLLTFSPRPYSWFLTSLNHSSMSRQVNRAYYEIVRDLRATGFIHREQVFDAFLSVDRTLYSPENFSLTEDSPLPIGHGQTISAANIHAMATEALYPALTKPEASILDVGCGSGFLTAVFARLNPTAKVYGIDCVPELVSLSKKNMMKQVQLRSSFKVFCLYTTVLVRMETFFGRRG